ncbi:MAG: cadherin domain-containing protein [Ekhidna sp.]|nr:cadherin domain-containing protein [Ekhidna sp.]
MSRVLIILVGCLAGSTVAAQDLEPDFARYIGDTGNDQGFGVAADSEGNVWATGFFHGSIDIDRDGSNDLTSKGGRDSYITKFDRNRNLLAAFTIGSSGDDQGNSIATDSDGNAWAIGYFQGSIDMDGDGTNELTSKGERDGYVIKFDSDGSLLAAFNIGGSSDDRGIGIVADGEGNVWTTGFFQGSIDMDGDGTNELTSKGDRDSYVIKFDRNGSLLKALTIGGSGDDRGIAIAAEGNGNVWVTGRFQESIDIDGDGTNDLTGKGGNDGYVVRFDRNGNLLAAFTIGGSGDDRGIGIAADSNGNAWATGFFHGSIDMDGDGSNELTSNGGSDSYVAKFGSNGDLRFAFNIGSSDNDGGSGITVDSHGHAWAVGHFKGGIDLDGDGSNELTAPVSFPSLGTNVDGYVVRFGSNGDLRFALSVGEIAIDNVFNTNSRVNDIVTDSTGETWWITGSFGWFLRFKVPGDAERILVTDNSFKNSNNSYVVKFSNAAPTGLSLRSSNLSENVTANTAVGTFTTTDPDTGDTFTYELADGTGATDNAAFTIAGDALQINSSPDYETKSRYDIRVSTTDTWGNSYSESFTITVTNVNEAPTDIELDNKSINENVTANTAVGTFTTTDPDTGDTFTYELADGTGDTDNAAFTIAGDALQIISSPDFETQSSYDIRVQTTDAGGNSYSESFTVTVTNVNEAPTDIELDNKSINENVAANTVVGTFTTTDPDTGDTFTYELADGTGDADNTAFTIVGNQLQINSSPDYETKSRYDIRVQTTDAGGESYSESFTVTVTNVNEAPTLTVDVTNVSLADGTSSGTVVATVTGADEDVGDASNLIYSIVSGDAHSDFAIDSGTGVITVAKALSRMRTAMYTLEVQAADAGGKTGTIEITVRVNAPGNTDPTVTAGQTFSVAENSTSGTAVGTVAGTDADTGDNLTYRITGGNAGNVFSLAGSGEITTAGTLNHEGTGSYTLTVRVSDGNGGTGTGEVTINITDVNEAPAFAMRTYSQNVAENTAANTAVVTVSATDEDDTDTPTYEITSGNTGDVFAIDVRSGQITIAAGKSLDHEGMGSYTLTVTARDDADTPLTDEATVTLTVDDVNEAPEFGNAAYMQNVAENTAVDAVVVTVSATDEDDTDTPTYEITSGNTNNDFKINANTGVIAVAKALTGKVGNRYTLTVSARDDADTPLTAEATVTLTVTDVNDNDPVITSDNAKSVAENTTTVLTVTATDADANTTLTYSVSGGADEDSFSIDDRSGALTFNTPPDFEAPSSNAGNNTYVVQVTANDGTRDSSPQTITVTVTGVNDNAPVITSDNAKSVAENTTTVLTVTATDADANTTLTYSVSGGSDRSSFGIDQNSGALMFNTAPDFEAKGSAAGNNTYVVQVTANDGTRDSSPQTITVTVTDDPNDDVLGVPSAEGVVLYPNPASGHFRLTGISGQLSEVTLIGTEGKAVRSYPVSKSGLYDLSGLNEGLFFVFTEGDGGRKAVGRIVIRK